MHKTQRPWVGCLMSICFWIVPSLLKLGNCHCVRYDVCSVDVKSGELTLRDKVPPTQWPTLLVVTHLLFICSLFLVVPLSQPSFLCTLCIPLPAPAEPMVLAALRFVDALSPRYTQTTLNVLHARSNYSTSAHAPIEYRLGCYFLSINSRPFFGMPGYL